MKMDIGVVCMGVSWSELPEDSVQCRVSVKKEINFRLS